MYIANTYISTYLTIAFNAKCNWTTKTLFDAMALTQFWSNPVAIISKYEKK